NLPSITIPSSVTSVGNFAFDNCTGLKEVVIENSNTVLSLGYNGSSQGLFYDCPLEKVHLGRNLSYSTGSSYGYSPFYNKDGLRCLTIGAEVTSIGDYAFYGCDNIYSLTIGVNITNIGNNAFSNPNKIIWIPNTPPSGYANISGTLNYVPNQQYTSLGNTKVYPHLSSSFDVDGVKYVPLNPSERTCCVLDYAYDSITTTISVSETLSFRGVTMHVEEIAPYAFANNDYIREVTISHKGNIGDHAFYDCDSIQSVQIYNQGNIGSQSFYGCESLETAVISNITSGDSSSGSAIVSLSDWTSTNHGNHSSTSSETYTFATSLGGTLQFDWSVSSESNFDWLTVILDGTEIVHRSGVYNGTYLNENLSEGDHTLVVRYSKDGSQNSGMDQASISNIVVTSSVNDVASSIGSQVFENCSSLKYITLGDGVRALGNRMFKGCTSLQEIAIPDSVTLIGDYCFQDCSSLSEITLSQSVQRVGKYAFSGCSSLSEFVIPQSLFDIGNYAFNGCSSMSEIVIPSTMKTVGNYAFNGCTSLSNVIIENRTDTLSLGSNGSSALFANCPLDSVYIGGKIAGVLAENSICSPFYCNTSLRTVVIGNYEDLICANEFYGCTNLNSVVVGHGVSTIGDYAFSGCSNLRSITLGSNMEHVGSGVFSGCLSLSSITSHVLVPPSCSPQALDDINKWECILYVPLNSAPAYQIADHWKEFFCIDDCVEIEKYSLTYMVDGEVFHIDSLAHKDVVTMLDEPIREGHTFSGWDKTLSFMLAEDVEVNGRFSVNTYEMKYVVDGDVLYIDSIPYGERVELFGEPMREGYTFSGWENVFETMPAYDVVIEGHFLRNRYQVTYMIDGEIVNTDSIEFGMSIVTPDAPTKEGYSFSWGDVLETMPAMDLVYQGEYVMNNYMLSFMIDGNLYAIAQMVYGATIFLPDVPDKEGYTFSWGDVPETMPAMDVVYQGHYVKNSYMLTFRIDGYLYEVSQLEYGKRIHLPSVPKKEGYDFSWDDVLDVMPAEDVVIEGYYTIKTYNVYYYVGGTLVHTEEVVYGGTIPGYTYDSVADGEVFLGWDGDTYETMPAYDIIYTAIISNGINSTLIGNGQLMIYDLNGRRVVDIENIKEGFYIVNGKKVMLR
ncbi:MAG: leucine-rich repeat protein, partial [Bacteroidaceae bacterium]|nr:leucine-rich repeat protein [Bacteroidaceae bacterium]